MPVTEQNRTEYSYLSFHCKVHSDEYEHSTERQHLEVQEAQIFGKFRARCQVQVFQLYTVLQIAIPRRWNFQSFHADVFNLRSFDLSPGLRLPPSIQSPFLHVSQHRSLTAIGLKKASFSVIGFHYKYTKQRQREELR